MDYYTHNPNDITPEMTADDAPSPNVVSASSSYGPLPPWKAFMHTVEPTGQSCWAANVASTGWLKFDLGLGNSGTAETYTVTCGDSVNLTRSPKTWTLQGSNNDADWDVLDTQTNVPAWTELGEMRTYSISIPAAYRYYKLNITASQGGSYLTVGELELIAGETPPTIIDLNTEIKASEEVITDLLSEIIAGLESLTDLKSEIRAGGTSLIDLKSDIAADFLTDFANLSTEISVKAQEVLDLLTDISAGNQTLIDLDVDVEAKAQQITDLLTDISAQYATFKNLNTEITAVRSKWWLKTEIKAGCAARWNFNTEWNPNRFLNTEIEAKKPYEFSFKTQADQSYAATEPTVELLVPGYSFPMRTLFLDYLQVGSNNEYPLELFWARGLVGKGTLKNVKIRVEYVNSSNSGGLEVVTYDWLSVKVDEGDYSTVNETALTLGDIPCDSKLSITLKVECPACGLSRGIVFFKLIFTGDHSEALYGGPVVYNDGSQYHAGLQDDYESISFVSRLYVVE